MRIRSSSVLASVMVAVSAFAFAAAVGAAPIAQVSIGGGTPQSIPLTQDGKIWFAAGYQINDTNFSVTINSLVFDPDPSIVYGIDVQNNTGSPLSFSFLFSQTITLTSTPGAVNTSIQGGTTIGDPGTVTYNPLAPPGAVPVDSDGNTEIQVFTLSDDGGTTLFNADLDLGPAFTSSPSPPANASQNSPPINSPQIAGPIPSGSSYDFMRVDLNFDVTGGGDHATLSGSARVVPEPTPAAMLMLGLIGLGYAGRRRA